MIHVRTGNDYDCLCERPWLVSYTLLLNMVWCVYLNWSIILLWIVERSTRDTSFKNRYSEQKKYKKKCKEKIIKENKKNKKRLLNKFDVEKNTQKKHKKNKKRKKRL